MATTEARPTRLWTHAVACLATAGLITAALSFGGAARAASNDALDTAGDFAVLAGTGITNVPATTETGPTVITGDIGSFPTASMTIPDLVLVPPSVNQAGNAVTQGAKTDLVTAYELAEEADATTIPTELSGSSPLTAGVYDTASGELGLTGTVTLQGGPDDIFIFQADSTLITAADSTVVLDGVSACNVFWQVGSSATFGADSAFSGTVMALTAITAGQGATFDGRLLARNAGVSLDNNTITRPSCEGDDAVDGTVTDADGADVDGSDVDGSDADGDVDGTDVDGSDVGGDVDGTDVDGSDVGGDVDGTDVDGTDVDGSDADGDVDGADVDASDVDGGVGSSGSPPSTWLPGAGGPSGILLALGVLAAIGGAAVLVARGRTARRH